MKTYPYYLSIGIALLMVSSCGPAKESRETMEKTSVRLDDSIRLAIDSLLRVQNQSPSFSNKALITTSYVFEYR